MLVAKAKAMQVWERNRVRWELRNYRLVAQQLTANGTSSLPPIPIKASLDLNADCICVHQVNASDTDTSRPLPRTPCHQCSPSSTQRHFFHSLTACARIQPPGRRGRVALRLRQLHHCRLLTEYQTQVCAVYRAQNTKCDVQWSNFRS